MITILNDHEIYLTYSWNYTNHGICGHTFEVIDYYLLLKNHFNIGILLQENIDQEIFRKAISEKYNLDDIEIQDILDNTVYHYKSKIIKCKNLIVVDGAIYSLKKQSLLCDNVFLFGCGDKDIINVNKKNWHVLLDHRIYGEYGINYIKKINFKRLKFPSYSDKKTLIYATESSRYLSREYVEKLVSKYPDNFIIICNEIDKYRDIKNTEIVKPPINNLSSRFDKYLYTPTLLKNDCSPRFIAECKYFKKEVEYYDIDYLEKDLGLKYRIQDLKNIGDISLEEDDEIIEILKGII